MTHQAWYPKASKAQLFSGGVAQPTISKLVLHSTEGTGWPGYNGGASAPTFTVRPIWDEQRVEVRQHFAANISAKALVDKAGGVRTNRDNVAQIEIIGTSGWATRRNKAAANGAKGTYLLGEQWYVANYPWWFWRDLGALVRWYHDEWELPLTGVAFPSWAGGGRMSDSTYDNYEGVLGHSHVPENDHTDPGPIPVQTLLKYARDAGTLRPAIPAGPAAPSPKEFPDMDATEFKKLFKAAFKESLRDPEIAGDVARAALGGTYGIDASGDGKPDTAGNLIASIYTKVAAINSNIAPKEAAK